jgi:beta-aspartyl-peptidase (threonine type)
VNINFWKGKIKYAMESALRNLHRRNQYVLRALVGLALILSTTSLIAQTKNNPKDEAAIRAVLTTQTEAWNEQRLEDFMQGYWKSPELSFFSGTRKVKGWEATLARYRTTYQSEGREMGQLRFSELEIQMLGPTSAFVRGRFELAMKDGKKPTGIYTLIFRKFGREWKIVHDHTSSDQ